MSSENVKGSNTGRIISIVVGAALVALLAFFIYKYMDEKSKNQEIELTNDTLTAEIQDLETDLDDYRLDLENQDIELEQKEVLLAEKEQMIIEKQKKIDQLLRQNKITSSQAEGLRSKVASLEYYIRKYQGEIDELKTQVTMLTDENDSLKGQVSNMNTKVRSLERVNDSTKFKLQVASILKALNFSYAYVRSNGKTVQDNPIRKGRMDHVQICFNVVENLAAKAGEREVYLQIMGPNGTIVRDGGAQSGTVEIDGTEEAYTAKKSLNYDRTTVKVCMDFKKSEDYEYEKGSHKAIVFCEGFEIGRGNFEVK